MPWKGHTGWIGCHGIVQHCENKWRSGKLAPLWKSRRTYFKIWNTILRVLASWVLGPYQIVMDCMHHTLEGNVQDHFHQILALTKESAQSKPTPTPVFTYKFAIYIEESPLPDDMTLREAKQVEQIHLLLTAPFKGVDDTVAIVDQMLFDDSITQLLHHLSGKNTKPLKFICGNIKLVPHNPTFDWPLHCLILSTSRKTGLNASWSGYTWISQSYFPWYWCHPSSANSDLIIH